MTNLRKLIPAICVVAILALAVTTLVGPTADADSLPNPSQQAVAETTTTPVAALMAGSVVGAPEHQSVGPVDTINNKYLFTSRSRSPFVP